MKQRDDAIALLQKDQAALRRDLDAASTELAAKSAAADTSARRVNELDVEKADLLRQLDVSKTQLAAKANGDQEKAELAAQLEATKAELNAKRAVENEKAELAAQLCKPRSGHLRREAARTRMRRCWPSNSKPPTRRSKSRKPPRES